MEASGGSDCREEKIFEIQVLIAVSMVPYMKASSEMMCLGVDGELAPGEGCRTPVVIRNPL